MDSSDKRQRQSTARREKHPVDTNAPLAETAQRELEDLGVEFHFPPMWTPARTEHLADLVAAYSCGSVAKSSSSSSNRKKMWETVAAELQGSDNLEFAPSAMQCLLHHRIVVNQHSTVSGGNTW